MNAMQRLLPAIACFLGLLIAYVDSRPTWDDTGITAGSILLVSGLLAMLADRRPWRSRLAGGSRCMESSSRTTSHRRWRSSSRSSAPTPAGCCAGVGAASSGLR